MSASDGDAFSCTVDPPVIGDARLLAFRNYWDAKRGARAMPLRSEIDPAELRGHLPNLFMFDALDGATDFRFRLLGTAITGTYGRDSTGKTIREIYWPNNAQLGEWTIMVLRHVVTSCRPVIARAPLRAVQKEFIAHVTLGVPLSRDGAAADIVFGETHFLKLGESE